MPPVAYICLRCARGEISPRDAVGALRPWARDKLQAEYWVASALQPMARGYGELSSPRDGG